MTGGHSPPGWPTEVAPPNSDGWERSAVAWLLDLCPSEHRSYLVLRRQPVLLARFARHHVEAGLAALRHGYSTARGELRELVTAGSLEPGVVEEAIAVYEQEGARLAKVAKSVALVEAALSGKRYVARL